MTEPASCAQTGGAVLAEIALLEMEGMDLAFLQAHHRLAADLQIVGMRDLEESQRLDFHAGISEHVGEGGIGLKDAAIEGRQWRRQSPNPPWPGESVARSRQSGEGRR